MRTARVFLLAPALARMIEKEREGGLVRQVLVERRGADAQGLCHAPHGQGLGASGFQQFTTGGNDLLGTGRPRRLSHGPLSQPAPPAA